MGTCKHGLERRLHVGVWCPNRRTILKAMIASGGAWALGMGKLASATSDAMAPPYAFDTFIRIGADNRATLVIPASEMGQGVSTALAMILAEEIDLDWRLVTVELARNAKAYVNPAVGEQETGGSLTVSAFWKPLALVGAAIRSMLVSAAAARWGVDPDEVTTRSSRAHHRATGRTLTYAAVVLDASKLQVPARPRVKPRSSYRLIGRPIARVEGRMMVDGSLTYGIDVVVPQMLVASVLLPPVYGSPLESYDAAAALSRPGVTGVYRFSDGVAVLARGFWAAKQARDALAATARWGSVPMEKLDSDQLRQEMAAALDGPGVSAEPVGNAEAILDARTTIRAEYELPFLAHACMEPMNATAWVQDHRVDVWAPTQVQQASAALAGALTGMPAEQVTVHTTYMGGGFGRRFATDFIRYAVELSLAAKAPVKVIFTREDDLRAHHYRPAHVTRMRASLDDKGRMEAMHCRTASASTFEAAGWKLDRRGVDPGAVEGLVENTYGLKHLLVEWVQQEAGPRVWFWRSTGHSANAFALECFVDELASASGDDPVEFRLKHLAGKPRHRQVLQTAAKRSSWGTAMPVGRGRGIAMHDYRGTIVAMVAEVSLDGSRVRVTRVVAAVDAGRYVNPQIAKAQIEGGVASGLAQALYMRITFEHGRVQQSNFHDYPVPTLGDMPAVEVQLLTSDAEPSGMGEAAVPLVAPAVANALHALTGKRHRVLPLTTATASVVKP